MDIKEESKDKKFLENYDIVLDEENSEEKNGKNDDKKPAEKFSQQLFDWRKKNK